MEIRGIKPPKKKCLFVPGLGENLLRTSFQEDEANWEPPLISFLRLGIFDLRPYYSTNTIKLDH